MLTVTAASAERDELDSAVRKAAAAGLRLELEHLSRWRWARERPARVVVSETGGCACSLLSDDADWGADTWAMRPEFLEPLARTLEFLAEAGPDTLAVEALWIGEAPRETVRVTSEELVALARSSGLGTRTRYEISLGGVS